MLRDLPDTNICIYLIKHRPPAVREVFDRHLAVGEDVCSRLVVLPLADKAATLYGSIRAELERLGTPIGVNDLHIAAHARSEGLVRVTNNSREFERVAGLRLENWVAAAHLTSAESGRGTAPPAGQRSTR